MLTVDGQVERPQLVPVQRIRAALQDDNLGLEVLHHLRHYLKDALNRATLDGPYRHEDGPIGLVSDAFEKRHVDGVVLARTVADFLKELTSYRRCMRILDRYLAKAARNLHQRYLCTERSPCRSGARRQS